MDVFLTNLMVVFALAVFLGIIFRLVGLPSLVGQVLAGFLIGLSGMVAHDQMESLGFLGTLGVTLLLFLVGLEMNFSEIKRTGKTVIKIFLLQTGLLSLVLFLLSYFWLGLSTPASVMLSIALSFSSTIVVVKMLSENKDLGSFSGKISMGILLLQDLLAIFVLALLPGLAGEFNVSSLGVLALKLSILFLVINIIGQYLITQLQRSLVKTTEDMVLLSLVWFSLCVYYSVKVLHLTPEIGGILAGISLSGSVGHFQIASKVKTLRDIFLTVFFVILGLEIGLGKIDWLLVLLLVFVATVLKFVAVELSSYLAGLSGKAAFSVSINMTQLSEFSLIVLAFGVSSGLWDKTLVTGVTMAGLISMVLSTVLMNRSAIAYKYFATVAPKLFKFGGGDKSSISSLVGHVVLLGGDRTGRSILAALKKNGETVLVVDFNQDVVKKLIYKGEKAIFADVSDPDVVELTNMKEAKMIISTVKDINDTMSLLSEIRQQKIMVPTIVDAETAHQARELYQEGASYVIFPHFVSGLHLGQIMKKFEKDLEILKKYRIRQNESLKEIYDGEF